jgi:hypothetical protein
MSNTPNYNKTNKTQTNKQNKPKNPSSIRDSSKIQLQYPDTQYSRIQQNQLKTKENKQAQIPDLDVKGTKPSSLLPHPCARHNR